MAFCCNTRVADDEFNVEFEPEETIEHVGNAIEEAGWEFQLIEADEDCYENLRRLRPDMVFNRAEGLRGESRESQVPAFCEMLGIPYVGSGPKTLAVCLDKAWTKTFVAARGVDTPDFEVLAVPADVDGCRMDFPIILKPNAEGSSIGINEDNVVRDHETFVIKAKQMLNTYRQPILAEQFIAGREISVGMIGRNGSGPEILPLLEVDFSRMPESVGNVFGQIAKTEYDDMSHYLCPARVNPGLEAVVKAEALRVWRSLGIRDFVRIDFRVDEFGRPRFLEANPLPGMDFNLKENDFSFFTLMAFRGGYDFDSLVAALIDSAMGRMT